MPNCARQNKCCKGEHFSQAAIESSRAGINNVERNDAYHFGFPLLRLFIRFMKGTTNWAWNSCSKSNHSAVSAYWAKIVFKHSNTNKFIAFRTQIELLEIAWQNIWIENVPNFEHVFRAENLRWDTPPYLLSWHGWFQNLVKIRGISPR